MCECEMNNIQEDVGGVVWGFWEVPEKPGDGSGGYEEHVQKE